eukprot:7382202-Prymnesium_polylepis.1
MPCWLAPTSLRKSPHELRGFARGLMAGGVGAPTFPTPTRFIIRHSSRERGGGGRAKAWGGRTDRPF